MKKRIDHINDDLLVKYLLGITDESEKAGVEEWLAENKEHQRYLDHFRLIWEESRKLAAVTTVNEDDAWKRFQQRVGADVQTSGARIIKPGISTWRRDLRIAATLIVLFGAGCFWYISQLGQTAKHTIYSQAEVKLDTLPDGSFVTLNKQSSITYPVSFERERRVQLKGEAFFNIAQDPGKPFVIRVNDVTVKVLGTSFNIKSVNGSTEVIVESGAVEVTKKSNSVKLQQYEKAVVTENEDAPVKQRNTDELYNYYRTQTFVCNNTPLWKLVDILNEAYGVDIVIANNSKRDMPISVTFANSSLDSTLKIIGLTFDISIEKNGSQITLK
ncbi:MAG TPA: FecR domain-containing protein [Chitinophaga sp.]|uniref:FecR domain-containing protein n=1 Tax=Chitinophaga sp. TaxID=1869181 RepID=UPI002BA286A8|nr:FecR domain-containing protein [Chitinophaga sp.]HVI48842.1 FecR domain-containing protein [Chitinophaga sp.]